MTILLMPGHIVNVQCRFEAKNLPGFYIRLNKDTGEFLLQNAEEEMNKDANGFEDDTAFDIVNGKWAD